MKSDFIRCALVLLLLVTLSGCDHTGFKGDGSLTDSGPGSAHERYTLTLGRISEGRHSFEFEGLPREAFAFGLSVTAEKASVSLCESKPISTMVSLTLTRDSGAGGFSEAKPLDEWTWSCSLGEPNRAFVYVRDASGGSIFRPEPDGQYSLVVSVSGPMPGNFEIEMIAKGGGLK